MPIATVVEEAIGGVPGVRFTTDARPGTAEEAQLLAIQDELSGGEGILPPDTTLPQLSMVWVGTPDGDPYSAISLRVPADQRSEATELLRAAGFTISDG
jgi:hypothetical protein